MVSVLKQVDIVISALPNPLTPDQINIVDAIIAAGNIKVKSLLFRARENILCIEEIPFSYKIEFEIAGRSLCSMNTYILTRTSSSSVFCCCRGSYHPSLGAMWTGPPPSRHSRHAWIRRRR